MSPSNTRLLSISGLTTVALTALLTTGCGSSAQSNGSENGGPAANAPGATGPGAGSGSTAPDPGQAALHEELPWEIVSDEGETYLPNIFYAEASENQQVMPYALGGHVQIDRMIYPTLGNPNLYVRSDADDSFMMVLRLEDAAIAHLSPQTTPVAGSRLSQVTLTETLYDTTAFLLIPHAARDGATENTAALPSGDGTQVTRILPAKILVNPIDADMPAQFQTRKTYRFIFDQAAMKNVANGLYDVRFEVRKNNQLFTIPNTTGAVYEYQYNALRVFDSANDQYSIMDVTDTQYSVGDIYGSKTADKLTQFVSYVAASTDPNVLNTAFVTFNGDLHNGGSPGGLRAGYVATDYAAEANGIVETLKNLPFPIFLTAGNHDGYVSTGQVPEGVTLLDDITFDGLESAIDNAGASPWPGYTWSAFQAYTSATNNPSQLGGIHEDIYSGEFIRYPGKTFTDGWQEVPISQRNMILYDGFYQWQKSYGPLNYSFRFGKSFYLSANSFDLRQHRRSGWGMFTVNYGGGISPVQMSWIDRELTKSDTLGTDAIILEHHDPRGGHNGKDYGYYFNPIDYAGIGESTINYLVAEVIDPELCKLPSWAVSVDQEQTCIHDGLEEWMRPDVEFDCDKTERGSDGKCDQSLFDPSLGAKAHSYYFSAMQMISLLNTHPSARTLLLGHTHFNAMEVLQPGDQLVPSTQPNADPTLIASLDVQNPVRGYALQNDGSSSYDASLPSDPITENYAAFEPYYDQVASATTRAVPATKELAILRLTSNADLTSQSYGGSTMLGFAIINIAAKSDARNVTVPQVNHVLYFINQGSDAFGEVKGVDVPRTQHTLMRDANNPVQAMFTGEP